MTKLGFYMKTNRFALLALLTLAGSVPAFSETTFTATGAINMIPTSMSDDASIVVGTGPLGTPNLYYTEAHGASIIGEGCFSGLPAISGDGTTVLACERGAQGLWNIWGNDKMRVIVIISNRPIYPLCAIVHKQDCSFIRIWCRHKPLRFL